MRLLVIEDDRVLHHLITKRLKEEGHSVDDCYDGESGFDYADSMQYDCIILDLMLPKRDGISILKELRSKGNPSPVLILTARDSIDDRVMGLDAGADDYLVKPFAFDEFSVRVRALLRRGSDTKSAVLSLADLTLNTTNRKITRGERNITLTSTEYALLEYLLRNQGHVLTRSQIADHVWNYSFEYDSNKVPEDSVIYGNQSLMTQLLINLIGNSIKYGAQGGKVTVRATNSEKACTFTISDNGIGIKEDELEHIFERFYRANKARDRSGSGLGLSIVKWIVELHNGKITVNSEFGKGTQVTVSIPAKTL